MKKSYFVYILSNYKNTVFYTGITNDLQRRLFEHKQGSNKESFAHRYHIYKLLWYSEFSNPLEAIEVEKKVKDWRREKKIKLILELNPTFKDLSSSF